MEQLISLTNGWIRNSIRLPQFQKICGVLAIAPRKPLPLSPDSPWFGGFWDADGSITLWQDARYRGHPSLRLSAANKHRIDLEPWCESFGGGLSALSGVRGDGQLHPAFQWQAGAESDLRRFHQYYLHCQRELGTPFRSKKSLRIALIPDFFELRRTQAYLPDSPLHAQWHWKIHALFSFLSFR